MRYKFEIYMKRINQFVNSSGNTTQYSCVRGASSVANLSDFGRCTDITLSLTMRINVIKVAGELSVSGVCNRNPGGVGLKITPNFPTLDNRTNVNIRVNNGSWRGVKNKTEYWYDLSDSYADGANHNFTVELASYGYFPGTTKTIRLNCPKVAPSLTVTPVCNRKPDGIGLDITPNFPTFPKGITTYIQVRKSGASWPSKWTSTKNKTVNWYNLTDASYNDGSDHYFDVQLQGKSYIPGTTSTRVKLNCPVPKYSIVKKTLKTSNGSNSNLSPDFDNAKDTIISDINDQPYFIFRVKNIGATSNSIYLSDKLPPGLSFVGFDVQYKRKNGTTGSISSVANNDSEWSARSSSVPGDEITIRIKVRIKDNAEINKELINTACITVGNASVCDTASVKVSDPQPRPILSVLNGDITVGSSPTSDPTMYNRFGCDSSSGTGSNVDGSVDGTTKGSNTNLAIFATGGITNFFSNYEPLPIPSSTSIDSLKFYNYRRPHGGYPSICRPNPSSSADPVRVDSVELRDALRAADNSLARTVKYQPSSGVLTIGGGTVQGGPSKAIFVDGHVYIPNNIELASSYSNKNQAPSLTIIATGDIRIAPEVDKLEGLYISNGTFNTCTKINNSLSIKNSSGGQACYKQLNVYGAIMAKTVKFRRTYGGLDANLIKDGKSTREAFAETITFAPELIFNAPPLGVAKTIEKMGYKELPPVL
jgi:hypothetical protein